MNTSASSTHDPTKYITIGLHAALLTVGLPINGYHLMRIFGSYHVTGTLNKFGLLKLHLIIADIIILLVYSPSEIADTVGLDLQSRYVVLCKGREFLTNVVFYFGSNIIVVIAIERLRGVLQSTTPGGGKLDDATLTRKLIATAWLLSFLQASPQLILWNVVEFQSQTYCYTVFRYDLLLRCFNETSLLFYPVMTANETLSMPTQDEYFSQCFFRRTQPEVIYAVCFLCMVFYIPTAVIISCNIVLVSRIVRYGREAQRKLLKNRAPPACTASDTVSDGLLPKKHWTHRARTSAIRKTTILSIAYIVCWAPYNLFSFVDVIYPEWSVEHHKLVSWFYILIGLNAVLNPIIYRWSVSGQVPSYRNRQKGMSDASRLRATAV